MIVGINQNVAIFGRDFHVQTEVSSREGSHCIRTRVYLAGRIIGAREQTLEGVDETAVKAAMQEQHETIIDNMTSRLQAIAAAKEIVPPPPPPAVPAAELEPAAPSPRRMTKIAVPNLDEIPGVRSSVQIRRLLAGFRNSTNLSPPSGPDALRLRLADAAALMRDIVASPTFAEARVEEQVRFHDLLDRLDAWLAADADHHAAVQLWSQVAVFSAYLGNVNNRHDLMAFDRRLVMWGLSTVGEDGLSPEVVSHLSHLYGRDLALDLLLHDPTSIDRDLLVHTLMGILDSF